MRNVLKIFVCSALAVLFAFQLVVTGEAAAPKRQKKTAVKPAKFVRVAILPVINLQEDIDYANTLVFQKALTLFRYPDYELYDNEKLYKALEELDYYEKGKHGVSEELLRAIMEKSGAEMVVMVKLNELTQEKYLYGKEDLDQLILNMDVMAVYSWQKKASHMRVREKKTIEYGAISKSDWKMQEFGRAVNLNLQRIANQGMKDK